MKKPSFSELIKNELVKRFESVVKKEINDYQNAHLEVINRISSLEEGIKALRNELQFLKNDSDKNYNDVSSLFIKEKNELKEEFEEQRKFIRINISEVEKHIKETNHLLSKFASLSLLQEICKEFNYKISSINIKMEDNKSYLESLIYNSKQELMKHYEESNKGNSIKLEGFAKLISEYNSKLQEFSVSTEGYLKEVKASNRDVFIHEKKIENIYTLMKRQSDKIEHLYSLMKERITK